MFKDFCVRPTNRKIQSWKDYDGERRAYLEPVNGTAVDEGWKLAKSVAERVTDRTHGEDDVQLIACPLDEEVEQRDSGSICLL